MERLPTNSDNRLPVQSESVTRYLQSIAQCEQVRQSLSVADRTILNALMKKKISEYNENEAAEKILQLLEFVKCDVGYNPKDVTEWNYNRVRIVQIICKYYNDLSIEDVKTAFEMLTIGELDKYLSNGDRKHYGAFTAEYVGKILNAYKQRQHPAIATAYEHAPKIEVKKTATPQEQEEGQEFEKRVCAEWIEFFKANGTLPDKHTNSLGWYYHIIKKWLTALGKFDEKIPNDEHRRKAYAEYIRDYGSRRDYENQAAYVRRVGIHAHELDQDAQRICDYDGIKAAFNQYLTNEQNQKNES